MSSIQVECWNCGLKLQVRLDKLATARCGNCQQAIAKEEQPETKPEHVQPLPVETRNETRAEEKSQIKQKQEEKGFSEAAAINAQNTYIPKVAHSVRAITPKELGLGLVVSTALSFINKIIVTLAYINWPSITRGAYPVTKFAPYFNFTRIPITLGFIRSVLILTLFFLLSLTRRFTRPTRYVIALLINIAALAAIFIIDMSTGDNADSRLITVSQFLWILNGWGSWLSMFLLFVALIIMDFLAQRMPLVEKPASRTRTEEWPGKFHQAKNGFGVFVIVLGALPLTLISSFFLSVFVCGTLLLVASGVTSKNFFEGIQTQPQLVKTVLYSVAAIIWFFMFRTSMRKGMRALKEGEGIFSALLSAILDPIRFLPGGSR